MSEKRAERESNFEILRVIAMIAIVYTHLFFVTFSNYNTIDKLPFSSSSVGALTLDSADLAPNLAKIGLQYVIDSMIGLGQVGNCIFFMIAGYFAVSRKSPISRHFKILKVVIQWTISFFLIGIIFSVFGLHVWENAFNIRPEINIFTYFLIGHLWFVPAYIFMSVLGQIFLIPCFRKLTHKWQLITIVMFLLAIPFFLASHYIPIINTYTYVPGWNFVCYIWVYLAGVFVYLKKDDLKFQEYFKSKVIIAVLLLFYFSASIFSYIFIPSQFFATQIMICGSISVILFLKAMNRPSFYNSKINWFAKASFGVYIFHGTGYAFATVYGENLIPYLQTYGAIYPVLLFFAAGCVYIIGVFIENGRNFISVRLSVLLNTVFKQLRK